MSGYYIYASLHQGRPALEIIDADSNQVCLQWEYGYAASQQHEPEQSNRRPQDLSETEIQRLFRRLLLLSCRQSLSTQGETGSNS